MITLSSTFVGHVPWIELMALAYDSVGLRVTSDHGKIHIPCNPSFKFRSINTDFSFSSTLYSCKIDGDCRKNLSCHDRHPSCNIDILVQNLCGLPSYPRLFFSFPVSMGVVDSLSDILHALRRFPEMRTTSQGV